MIRRERNLELRTDVPDKSEFSGKFPRSMLVLAAVGIEYDSEMIADIHWKIARFWHREKKYSVDTSVGTNEYGVAYKTLRWMQLTELPATIEGAFV